MFWGELLVDSSESEWIKKLVFKLMPNQNRMKKKIDGRTRIREKIRNKKSEKIGREFCDSIFYQ